MWKVYEKGAFSVKMVYKRVRVWTSGLVGYPPPPPHPMTVSDRHNKTSFIVILASSLWELGKIWRTKRSSDKQE